MNKEKLKEFVLMMIGGPVFNINEEVIAFIDEQIKGTPENITEATQQEILEIVEGNVYVSGETICLYWAHD